MRVFSVFLILVISVVSSYGLDCYDCIFHKGFPDGTPPQSESDCEYNPKNVITCNMGNIAGNYTAKDDTNTMVFSCLTVFASNRKVKVVERRCFYVDASLSNIRRKGEKIILNEIVKFEENTSTANVCNNKVSKNAGPPTTGGGIPLIILFATIVTIISK